MFLPGYYRVVHWRTMRAALAGNTNRAERIVSRAARRRPSDCAIRLVWAGFHARQGHFAEAKRIIHEAPERCATDYQLQCLLAQVLYLQGEQGEAERIARALTERDAMEGEAWAILAGIAAGAGRYEEALLLVAEAAARNLSAAMRANAASIAIRAGERELAETLAQSAIRDDPRDPGWHILLAVLLEGSDNAEATRQWRLAERHRPRVPDNVYRDDVEHYRSLMAKFGMRPGAQPAAE